jgi:hypothetical protein
MEQNPVTRREFFRAVVGSAAATGLAGNAASSFKDTW